MCIVLFPLCPLSRRLIWSQAIGRRQGFQLRPALRDYDGRDGGQGRLKFFDLRSSASISG